MHLRKGPEDPEKYAVQLCCTSAARVAWAEIIDRISRYKERQLNLLLPAYIGQNVKEGSGVFDPIRQSNSQYQFYRITPELLPDIDDLYRQIRSKKFDVLLVIHYFGFVKVNLQHVRELCNENDTLLVEDCAHCMFDHEQTAGSVGDFSFYSLHKTYATNSGGLLRINTNREELSEPLPNTSSTDNPVLLQVLRSNATAIANKRIENYQHLSQAIQGLSGVHPLWTLENETVPHNFPVLIDDGLREKLYFHLMDQGFPTIALYYQLADEIHENEYPESFAIAKSILNFPVHQDTDLESLDKLVCEVRNFYGQ